MFTFFTIYFTPELWKKIKHSSNLHYAIDYDTIINNEKVKNIIISQYMNMYIRQFVKDDDVTIISLIGKNRVDVFADKDIFDDIKEEIEDDTDKQAIVYRFPQPQFKPAMMHPSSTRYVYAVKSENITYKDIIDLLNVFGDIEIIKSSEYKSMVYIDNELSYETIIELFVDFNDYQLAEYFDVFMDDKMFVKLCDSCKLSQYGSAYIEVSEKEIDFDKYAELFNEI